MGLAANARLPEAIGDVASAMVDVLEGHMKSIAPTDEEYAAYQRLGAQYRELAARLRALAGEMAGYRDLPMPSSHDEEALSSEENVAAFVGLIEAEEKLLEILRSKVEEGRAMLDEWQP